ncbi:MAG: UDP-N-acetylglucosamine--LPS N-acetylglucosamine transferase [Anaerolineae bacterium]|nr:UDP-N-acetylglucosamine--LPS N-acetylglucosamine transferase [Anaerolineae bacterium]
MTKIFILYTSAGTGHVSAAKAVGEALAQHPDVEVRVEDLFNHINETARKTIVSGYNEISTNAQSLYTMFHSRLYKENTEDALKMNQMFTTLGRPFVQRFEKFVADSAPDLIINTMQYPLHLLKNYAEQSNTPEYAVITDISVQTTWLRDNMTGYFVASNLTRDVLLARGVDPEIIHVTGIPVKLELAEAKPMAEMRRRHDLPLDKPVITIFGGGIATDRIHNMVNRLVKADQPGLLTVVAGRNKDLLDALADITAGPHMDFRPLGYINYVDDLVAASDLVITKPGGLMTSEILARGTPTIIIDPIPGQEEWNADFVSGSGAGIQIRMPELVPPAAIALLAQPERLDAMRAQAQLVGKPRAAFDVADQVLADVKAGVGRRTNRITN